MGERDHEAGVRRALQQVWLDGHSPVVVRVRSELVRRPQPWHGVSARKLAPKEERPPLARVITPNGTAARLYLAALFEAHCTTRRGDRPVNRRPLIADDRTNEGWVDLVGLKASASRPGALTASTPRDNRVRQLKSALVALSSDEVRLVELPRRGAASDKFESFRVLHEGGSAGRANDRPYTVPTETESPGLDLNSAFFLKGWHYVLTDVEISAWLALHELRRMFPGSYDSEGVYLSGDERSAHFCLSKEITPALNNLVAFGLADVERDDRRRPDGTFEDVSEGEAPLPNRFRLSDAGLGRAAIDIVTAVLRAQI